MDKIIAMAREMGKLIQEEPAYLALQAATAANDADTELQEQIQQFETLRAEMESLIPEADKNAERLEELNTQLTALYESITTRPSMVAFDKARVELEGMLEMISQILMASANGENPETFQPHDHSSCGGDCCSCGGCH